MIEINEERQKVIDSTNNLLVMGGPGSGKTTIALIKAEKECSNLKEYQQILFLSFARATVTRVQEHCADLVTKENITRVKINTYHSFEWEIIKSNSRLLCEYPLSIILPHDATAIFSGLSEEEFKAKINDHFYKTGEIHFDLFATKTVELLSHCDCILRVLCDVYPIIVLDEFQDTNEEEWQLIKLLGKYSRLISLADPDQRIYDFRGASPNRISDYTANFDCDIFDFGTENNRSANTDILAFGNDLMNNSNKEKEYADVKVLEYGYSKIKHFYAKTLTLNIINKIKVEHPEWTIAILTASNDIMLEVSNCLNLSWRNTSGQVLPRIEHEVHIDSAGPSLAAEFISLILDYASRKQLEISSFISMLCRYILGCKKKPSNEDKKLVDFLYSYIETKKVKGKRRVELIQACESIVSEANNHQYSGSIFDDWKYIVSLFYNENIPIIKSINYHAKFIKLLQKGSQFYASLDQAWRQNMNYEGAAYEIKVALTQEHFSMANSTPQKINVMTIHKSKGKEFDIVIIYEGLHRGRLLTKPEERDRAILNLRVAATRARHKVYILTPSDNPCELL